MSEWDYNYGPGPPTNHQPYYPDAPQSSQPSNPYVGSTFYNSNSANNNSSGHKSHQQLDITHSKLTPTAREFTPSSREFVPNSRELAAASSTSTGAIKKDPRKFDSKPSNSSGSRKYGRNTQENVDREDGRSTSNEYYSKKKEQFYDKRSESNRNNVETTRSRNDQSEPENAYSRNSSTTTNKSKYYNDDSKSRNRYQNSSAYSRDKPKFYGSGRTGYNGGNNSQGNPVEQQQASSGDNGARVRDNYVKPYKNVKNNTYFGKNGNGDPKFGRNNNSGYNKENWRSRRTNKDEEDKEVKIKKKFNDRGRDSDSVVSESSTIESANAGSHRERLEEQLLRRTLECLVCCERLRDTEPMWHCTQCFHILHLECVRSWARASQTEGGTGRTSGGGGWRCPACQHVVQDIPKEYRCYCGKQRDPVHSYGQLPHSCGDTCARTGRHCEHRCPLPCHPGPCPECLVPVSRRCGCGRTAPTVTCTARLEVTCAAEHCGKGLGCGGGHQCERGCHVGDCEPCKEVVRQECYCGKQGRKLPCSDVTVSGMTQYCCPDVCDKVLSCGNHKCRAVCHEGPCGDCHLSPEAVTHCPCGQTPLTVVRKDCMDEIPCCQKVCGIPKQCGQPSAPHCCQSVCHTGDCPPCTMATLVRCRCGHMDQEMPCVELTTRADDARCQKKCTKKRQCCKHKCNQPCCIDPDHLCPLPCNRPLSCGTHRCPLTCHRGQCPPCHHTSWVELYCACGTAVLYPPVACGTRPPLCKRTCHRERGCGHEPLHACHQGECPPCAVLTRRLCHGGHEWRPAVVCHAPEFGCGLACGRGMECGRHKCVQACHAGACPSPCTQPCTEPRPSCGHPCARPCHGPCSFNAPSPPCRYTVRVTCECGLRTASRPCEELASDFQRIATAQLAGRMADIQRGQTVVDISDLRSRGGPIKTLECTEECRVTERNRRLAIGLQIRNPDLSSKLTPRYSEFMRGWAKRDGRFCDQIHRKLSELVTLSKQSKQRSRAHSFECMNRDKRQLVHEYAEHFGCETAAYDKEPNRNVIATAFKDKSWLPSYSLLEVIQRENGQRKVPGPVLAKNAPLSSMTSFSAATSTGTTGNGGSQSSGSVKLTARSSRPVSPPPAVATTTTVMTTAAPVEPPAAAIDYFNYVT